MSLADWTTSTSGGGGTLAAILDTVSPIQGAKSLTYQGVGNINGTGAAITGLNAGITNVNGWVRTMVELRLSALGRAGVFCMMQGASIDVAADCYYAFIDTTPSITLNKGAVRGGGGTTLLATALPGGTWDVGDVAAIMLQWERNPVNGDMHLTVWCEMNIAALTTYAYDNLVAQIAYVDTSSPYSTSLTMGVAGFVTRGGLGTDKLQSYDRTQWAIC
jgi:hypothetical protein